VLLTSTDERSDTPFALFRRLLLAASGSGTGAAAAGVSRWISSVMSTRSASVGPQGPVNILELVGLAETSHDGSRSPQGRRVAGFNAVADLFGNLAAQGGLAVLVDDLHGADTGSLQLLDFLKGELDGFPLIIIGFARSGSDVSGRYEHILDLGPLPSEATLELAQQIAGSHADASSINMRASVERSGGNPLFLEELIRAARDYPATSRSTRLPESLHAMLRARFDAQSEITRTFLQYAAIVGATFWASAVTAQWPEDGDTHAPTEDLLSSLRREGFVRRDPTSIYPGQTQWSFVHIMMREVSYDSCLRRDRKRGHKAVAKWLELRAADIPPAHYPMLANHYEQAGMRAKAADAWRRTGDAARDRYANDAVAAAYGRALKLQTSWSTQEVVAIQLHQAKALMWVGKDDEANAPLEAILASEGAGPTARTDALVHLARVAGFAGKADLKENLIMQARTASAGADLCMRLRLAGEDAFAAVSRGDYDSAAAIVKTSLAEAYAAPTDSKVLLQQGNLELVSAITTRFGGDLAAAEASLRRALSAYEQADNPRGIGNCHHSLSICLRDLGRYDEAAASARTAASLFRTGGGSAFEATARLNQAWCRLEGGYPMRARQLLQRLRDDLGGSLNWTDRVLVAAGDGLAAHALGLAERAEQLAAECLEIASEGDPGDALAWARHAAGVILSDVAMLEQAIDTWRALNRPAWLLRSLIALAPLVDDDHAKEVREEAELLRVGLAGG